MRKGRLVVFDTNFFGWLNQIDAHCELVDLICDVFDGDGVADHSQLLKMDYCPGLIRILSHHRVTDEQVALLLMTYKGPLKLEIIHNDDPTDLKLIVFAAQNKGSTLLTCEGALLQLSDELDLNHWCLKAVIHRVDQDTGGFFDQPGYKTQAMFDEFGKHSFFHYGANKRCPQCDSKNKCSTKSNPPKKMLSITHKSPSH